MKIYINKTRFAFALIALTALLLASVVGLVCTPTAFATENATQQSPMAYRQSATDNIVYNALERTNYVNTSSCRVINPESDTFEGLFGKNAVRKTPESKVKSYQLYFDYCFEKGKTYEISFWAKSVGASDNFYVKVWYASDGNVTKKEDLPKLEKINDVWTKYSFTFTSDENLYKCFKLTLEQKNTYQEIYYDQFSAVEVEDGYAPYVCGEQLDTSWWTLPANGLVTSFNGQGLPVAVKMTTGSLTSKIFEAPQSGALRLRFAVKRSTGATVTFYLKDAVGQVIDEVKLSDSLTTFYCDFTSSDLTNQTFVYVDFKVVRNGAEDYATVGMVEMISHTHDIAIQPSGYPVYDFANCAVTRRCNTCQLDLVTVSHDFQVTKQPTCSANGKKICQNADCGLEVTLPATGQHNYGDAVCSSENDRKAVSCIDCGGGRKYLAEEHNMVCYSLNADQHQWRCDICGYAEQGQQHSTGQIALVKAPSQTAYGFAVVSCEQCTQKQGLDLPDLGDTNVWSVNVVSVENCTQQGVVQYQFCNEPSIVIEQRTEATGHSYEAIKQMPNCTDEGISLHHKCTVCDSIKESDAEIKVLPAYGHDLSGWQVEIEPTLTQEGLRKMYCDRCEQLIDQQVVPALDEVNYTKYALDDHDQAKGFYYYYSSNEYGTYAVFVEGNNQDTVTIAVICVCCLLVIGGSVTAYCVIATKEKRKKGK